MQSMSRPTVSPEVEVWIKAVISAAIEEAQDRFYDSGTAAALETAPASQSTPRLLTVQQTTTYLNCSRATLYRWEQTGVLVPKRFGRKLLYEASDLDALIARAG